MIIVAPRTGPVIAGSCDHGVNTREGGTRYVATGFAIEKARGAFEKTFETGTIKDARPKVSHHQGPRLPDQELPTTPEGGQAMQKPRPQEYRAHCRPAATSGCQPVKILTGAVFG